MAERCSMAYLSLALLSACVVTVVAEPTLTCTTRNNYVFDSTLVIVECMASEDLYLTGNGGTGPYLSDMTSDEIEAAGVTNAQNWLKHRNIDGRPFPGTQALWVGNFLIKCGDITLSTALSAGFPTDFVFTPAPYPDPMDPLLATFGASVPAGATVARKVAAVFATSGPEGSDTSLVINATQWDACVQAETATFGFTGEDMTSAAAPTSGPPPYTFTDSNKKVIPATVVGIIKKEVLGPKCTAEAGAAVAQDLNTVMAELADVTSFEAFSAKRLTVNAFKSRRKYAQCIDLLQGLYDVTYETVSLKDTKACTVAETDDAWATDPCCNPALLWSQCCAARNQDVLARKCVSNNGVCTANAAAISSCSATFSSANAAAISDAVLDLSRMEGSVRAFVQDVVAPAVFEIEHPELGCDIKAKQQADIDKFGEQDRWEITCYIQIFSGKTKAGLEKCVTNSDCWSNECVDARNSMTLPSDNKCAKLSGNSAIEPLFRCMLAFTHGTPIGRAVGAELGFNPDDVTSTASGQDAMFIAALAKFRTDITEENCASAGGVDDWCTNSLTKEQCEKIEVTNAHEHDTRVQWIDDPTDTIDVTKGWCKQHYNLAGLGIFGDDAAAQATCAAATAKLNACVAQGAVGTLSTLNAILDQTACTDANGVWVNYGTGTFHRLKTRKTWTKDPATNDYSESQELGSQAKCEAEKGCNWDPWRQNGATTEALCLDRAGVAGTGEDVGKKMFCAKCQTPSECHERMSLGTCVINPLGGRVESTQCMADVGTGLGAPTFVENPWKKPWNKHYQCIRITGFDTLETCLPRTICPTSVPGEDGNDFGECASAFCYDPGQNDENACSSAQGVWKATYKAGAGLCIFLELDSKSKCEGASHTFWEGRGWSTGVLDTKDKCETGFCEDGKPGQEQRTDCGDSNTCTKSCKLCVSYDDSDNSKNRMCYDSSITDSVTCSTTDGHTWDGVAEKCKKTQFTGDATACTALGNHVYKDCNSFDKAQCISGCHLSDFQTSATCWGATGLCSGDTGNGCYAQWNYDTGKCMAMGFSAKYSTNTPHAQQYPDTADCNEVGAGNPVFQGTDGEDYKLMSSMQCAWKEHAECPTKAACNAAGDCDDWALEDWFAGTRSSCVKSIERWETDSDASGTGQRRTQEQDVHRNGTGSPDPDSGSGSVRRHSAGDRKWCTDYDPPLEWAGRLGCIDRTIKTEADCIAKGVGYSWMTGASDEATCTAHGGTCMDKNKDWIPYGGIAEASCTGCGDTHKWVPAAEWNSGSWQKASMFKGEWKAREWGSKNAWITTVGQSRLNDFANKVAARMFGQVYAQQVRCKLGPLVQSLPLIGCGCGAGTAPDSCVAVFKKLPSVQLAELTVFCNSMQNTPPLNLAAGFITYTAASKCKAGEATALETVSKIAIMDALSLRQSGNGRLLAPTTSKCDKHKVVNYWSGHVAGQKMGTALSTQMSNVQLCMNINVPASEVCDEYTVMDFALVHVNGTITPPLRLDVTVDAKGRYCATTTSAGAYLPIRSEETEAAVDDNSSALVSSCRSQVAAAAVMVVVALLYT